MPAPLTRSLGRFAAELAFESLPPAALEAVRLGVTDCLAVMFAGLDEPVTRIARESLASRGSDGEARLYLGAERAAAPDAALANGVAAHALDYDDVALGGHPSVVLVSAVLAEAEATGAGGRDIISAYVAGYETWARLIERDKDSYHEKGWHPTAVLGPVAAAAAIANLRRLDAEKATMAIAIAASLAAGVTANFGTMTKPFQAGRAASSGIVAAHLAAVGMTAADDAIEHRGGLLRALSPKERVDLETPLDDLGREWRIETLGLNVKKYPMCYGTHRALDAMLDLVNGHGLEPAAVAGIDVTIGRPQAAMLRNHRPVTGLEAKFSMEFAMASALVARDAGLKQLTDEFVRRPEVQDAMTRVRIDTTDRTAPDDAAFGFADRVALRLADGRRLESPEVRYARGHWTRRLCEEELWTKFAACAERALRPDAAGALFEKLQGLDRLESVRELRGAAA